MGWLFMSSLQGHSGPRQYLDAQFTLTQGTTSQRVLRSALVKLRTYYAAVESTVEGKPVEVWGCVCLVKYNPADKEGYIFGYKDMGESMGPCESACPVSILDLLTRTKNQHALDWRARCRTAANTRGAKPKLRHGHIVRFAEPIRFADGRTHQALQVVIYPDRPRRVRFKALDGQAYYRIGGFKDLDFSVVAGSAAPVGR